MVKAQPRQMLALGVRDQELFGEIRQDTYSVTSLVDHAVDHPPHAVIIDGTGLGEGGWRNRPDAGIGAGGHEGAGSLVRPFAG